MHALFTRHTAFHIILALTVLCALLALSFSAGWWLPCLLFLGLSLLGFYDLNQTRHAIRRNYPVIGNLRFLFEFIRPEVRQYFFEDDTLKLPFSRVDRSLVYQRAKQQMDQRPFGTQGDVYGNAYEWINHAMVPVHVQDHDFRVTVGGPDCTQPVDLSVFNISAMSFGALSANAVMALNKGAALGRFAHDTGEGGVSQYHLQHGGDLIWNIGSGYFGCRNLDGSFSEERFADMARRDNIRMIEIKLSQGAKPGHGGILPAPKVTPEIAAARGPFDIGVATADADGEILQAVAEQQSVHLDAAIVIVVEAGVVMLGAMGPVGARHEPVVIDHVAVAVDAGLAFQLYRPAGADIDIEAAAQHLNRFRLPFELAELVISGKHRLMCANIGEPDADRSPHPLIIGKCHAAGKGEKPGRQRQESMSRGGHGRTPDDCERPSRADLHNREVW